MRHLRGLLGLSAVGLALTFAPATARAQRGSASASAAASGAPSAVVASGPLPELPRLAPIARPEPEPAALQDLGKLLDRLTADDDRTRTNAKTALGEVGPTLVPAIRHRVQELRGTIDREALPRLLEAARKEGRKSLKKPAKGAAKGEAKDDEEDGDWLDFVLAAPRPRDRDWKSLVELLAMERMLATIGTTPAIRELIAYHAYFGEMFRIDLQRQVAKLKDRAVPALIEARQHDAKVVQRWANRQLDSLGRAIPGEAVNTTDTQVLADVLRAYGRTRDVDAVRVVLSFSNSDRIQLREASREAIAAIGEPGIWQLRDAYLSLTGNKPPRDWTWDRIARELFAMYDRARMAEVYKLMDDGVAAAGSKRYGDAIAAFDRVLARAPLFDRRKEMVPAYVARAGELAEEQRAEALSMLRKALRLDPKGTEAKRIEAEIAYLEGAVLIDQGTPDKFILQRALELDPSHERARAALRSLEDKAIERQTSMQRYAAAVAVGVAALLGMLLLARRRPARAPQ